MAPPTPQTPAHSLRTPQFSTPGSVDLTEEDDDESVIVIDEGPQVDYTHTIDESDKQHSNDLPGGCTAYDSYQFHSQTLKPGVSVELNDSTFRLITLIFCEQRTRRILLKGNVLHRTKSVQMLGNKSNELCLMLHAPHQKRDPPLRECTVTFSLEKIICVREVIFTNQLWPALNWVNSQHKGSFTQKKAEEEAHLVCRWKYTTLLEGRSCNAVAGTLARLKEEECNKAYSIPDMRLRREFRGESWPPSKTELQQSSKKRESSKKSSVPSISAAANPSSAKSKKRKHANAMGLDESNRQRFHTAPAPSLKTMFGAHKFIPRDTPSPRKAIDLEAKPRLLGELCAGIGGNASGAQQGGFKLDWLLDICPKCCAGLRLNFPGAKVLEEDLAKFCARGGSYARALLDVLHASFPCQYHSGAHTVAGKDDEKNLAAMYGSLELSINKTKPLIVTLEQTSAIVTKGDFETGKKGLHFHGLIRQLTDMNYSVRWEICNLLEYGNSQPRKRLIVIASCPGQDLPTSLEPTHGLGFGKKPFVTVGEILAKAKRWKHSVPAIMNKGAQPKNGPRTDPNKPLSQCIMTSGTKSIHPNSKRSFTLLELALLQGFLPHHQFVGGVGAIKKQIGNAVPAVFSKLLYEHIMESLEECDRKFAAWKPETIDLMDEED